jgi:hypothetical protein
MRDFYALAAAVSMLAGFASQALFVFATVASGWFVVVVSILFRTRESSLPAGSR